MGMDAGWSAPTGEAPPPILSIAVDPTSQLPSQGFATDSVAVAFDKNASVFGSAAHILGEIGAQVEIDDDPDWIKYPEIAAAAKQATGEEHAFAVAKVPGTGALSVGLGAGWKGRERAAKVAISLALIANSA